jgi:hypothetical protein
MWRPKEGEASDARGKHRAILDMSYELKGVRMKDGSLRDISYKDLYETDPFTVYGKYKDWHSGRVAAMRVRLVNPENADVLTDGFRTDSEFATFLKKVQDRGAQMNVGDKQMAADIENLKWGYDRLLGKADPAQASTAAQYARLVRKFNFLRVGGQFGLAQVMDAGRIIGELGVKAALSHMPSLRRTSRLGKEGAYGKVVLGDLGRELEGITGEGGDTIHGLQYIKLDDVGAANPQGLAGRVNAGLDIGQRLTANISGMTHVNALLDHAVQTAVAQKFADLSFKVMKDVNGALSLNKLAPTQLNRLRSIGLGDDMLKRVLSEVRKNADVKDGIVFSHKLTKLNIDKWSDAEAKAAFAKALFKWSHTVVVKNDLGNASRWMSTPMAQALFQFRSFMLNSWAKNTLYNLHHLDARSFASMSWSMVVAAMTYMVQENLRAVGRSDADKQLEERMSPRNIALAAFSKSAFSSILPMMIDSGLTYAGYQPSFDFRSSAQSQDLVFGNPSFGLLSDVGKATSGVVAPMLAAGRRPVAAGVSQHRQHLPVAQRDPDHERLLAHDLERARANTEGKQGAAHTVLTNNTAKQGRETSSARQQQ